MSRFDIDGEYQTCRHCEGTGKAQGPGGEEPCPHCAGKGETLIGPPYAGDDE